MKPSLFGCNQENGNKEVCSKLILSVLSQCVFVLEVFVNKKFQLDQELLGYFLVFTKNSWLNQELPG